MINTELYKTSDTAEASYLMNHDVQFVRVEKFDNDPKASIVLKEIIRGQINDLLLRWDASTERAFFLKYKWILKQVAPKNGNNL
jgi:hypothetical protein